MTSTLGKALGGSAGGFIAAPKPIVDLMRQRSRPYLFSNALPPPIVGSALKAIDLAEQGDDLRERLFANMKRFRTGMAKAGFDHAPRHSGGSRARLGDALVALVALAVAILDAAFLFVRLLRGRRLGHFSVSAPHINTVKVRRA